MGLMEAVGGSNKQEKSKELDKQKEQQGFDKEEFREKLELKRFLPEYSEDGLYVGPEPPGKFSKPALDEDDWCEEWQDKTGEFEYYEPDRSKVDWDTSCKRTTCQCGATVNMWVTQRQWRCRKCRRWIIDREWEDERIQNPNIQQQATVEDYL